MNAGFKPLLPLQDAWSLLSQTVQQSEFLARRGTEAVASAEALGRVLAADLVATVDVPSLDNSAMDGYALRAADVAQSVSRTLPQTQRIAAGQVGQALPVGECARIFTGAPVPEGADAVVMQEQTRVGESPNGVVFEAPVQPGQNIRRRGEDIASGQTVLHAGTRLSAAALGVAASVGADTLRVFTQPRVAVLTTGNELVMPGQPLPPGAIYNSNRHTLRALVQSAGGISGDMGIVPDDPDATREVLRRAAEHHDLIISSGGVSVGEEDHLKAAVMAEGQLEFWALAIKPGKPFVSGFIRRTDGSRCLYMGLPGNPSASFVTFVMLARPVMGVLAGEGWHLPRSVRLKAAFSWLQPDKRREFLRARLADDGTVALYPHQGSGVLSSAAWSDGLVDLPAGQAVKPGDDVEFLFLHECLAPVAASRQG